MERGANTRDLLRGIDRPDASRESGVMLYSYDTGASAGWLRVMVRRTFYARPQACASDFRGDWGGLSARSLVSTVLPSLVPLVSF